jgi:hypothetical protein
VEIFALILLMIFYWGFALFIGTAAVYSLFGKNKKRGKGVYLLLFLVGWLGFGIRGMTLVG